MRTRERKDEKKLGIALLARPDDHSFAREGIGLVSTLVLRMGYIVEKMGTKVVALFAFWRCPRQPAV